jgi:hypothetical protein
MTNRRAISLVTVTLSILAASLPAHAFPAGIAAVPLQPERFLNVGEKMVKLKPDPSAPKRPKMTQEEVQQAMDADIKARFDSAAGSSNVTLTAQRAKEASWGFVADHFAEIDGDHDGYIRYDDVATFMAARSPLKKKRADKPVQIVE